VVKILTFHQPVKVLIIPAAPSRSPTADACFKFLILLFQQACKETRVFALLLSVNHIACAVDRKVNKERLTHRSEASWRCLLS